MVITNAFRVCMPYVLQKVSGGWIMLNREYKPLGCPTGKFYNYNEHESILPCKIIKPFLKRLDVSGRGDCGMVYLYSGHPWENESEWKTYTEKLQMLVDIGVVYK